jgi:hypothetical protein
MSHEIVAAEYHEVSAAIPETIYSPMRPADKVAYAAEVATALKDVIVQRGLSTRIGGRDHISVEGWQTAAALCGVSCRVTTTGVSEDGNGYVAHAEAVRTDSGIVVGAGDGMCSRNERTWAKRDDYALRAMAQTRAVSRALRGVLAFIITLAGYEATPAEEMPPELPQMALDAPRTSQVRSKVEQATQAYKPAADAFAGISQRIAHLAAHGDKRTKQDLVAEIMGDGFAPTLGAWNPKTIAQMERGLDTIIGFYEAVEEEEQGVVRCEDPDCNVIRNPKDKRQEHLLHCWTNTGERR